MRYARKYSLPCCRLQKLHPQHKLDNSSFVNEVLYLVGQWRALVGTIMNRRALKVENIFIIWGLLASQEGLYSMGLVIFSDTGSSLNLTEC
jgi:hypothetical protein